MSRERKIIPEEAKLFLDGFHERYEPVPESGCWIWLGVQNPRGDGQMQVSNKTYAAHRVSFFIHNKEFDQLLLVRHSCDVPSCVNPAHLSLGTNKDNSDDMVRRGRQNQGSNVNTAKLTPESALAVYNAEGTHKEIGVRFGIDCSAVSLVKGGKSWKSVTGGIPNPSKENRGRRKATALAVIAMGGKG